MTIFTDAFLKKLGLFGEVLVPTPILSPYPPGKIRFFAGKIQFSREELRPGGIHKKDIIITDPSYRTDPLTENDTAEKLFWNHLFREGFNIFVWSGERIPVANYQELITRSKQVVEIAASDLLAGTQQVESLLFILDSEANDHVFDSLRQFDPDLILPLERLPSEFTATKLANQPHISRGYDSFAFASFREKYNNGKLIIPSDEHFTLYSQKPLYLSQMLRSTRYRHPIYLPSSDTFLAEIGLTAANVEMNFLINSQLKSYHYVEWGSIDHGNTLLNALSKYNAQPQSLYLTLSLSDLNTLNSTNIIQKHEHLKSISVKLLIKDNYIYMEKDAFSLNNLLQLAIHAKSLHKIKLCPKTTFFLLKGTYAVPLKNSNLDHIKEIIFNSKDSSIPDNAAQRRLQVFLQKTTNLEALTVKMYSKADLGIKVYLPKLNSLTLQGKHISWKDVCFFFSDNNKMSSLSVSPVNYVISEDEICNMPYLKSLNLTGDIKFFMRIKESYPANLSLDILSKIMELSPKLQRIKLVGFNFIEFTIASSKYYYSLQQLTLQAVSIESTQFFRLISSTPNLKKLFLTRYVFNQVIINISSTQEIPCLDHLEELTADLYEGNVAILKLLHKAPALKKLAITYDSKEPFNAQIPYMPFLKTLCLMGFSRENVGIAWHELYSFLSKAPNLVTLDIKEMVSLLPDPVEIDELFLPQLTHFKYFGGDMMCYCDDFLTFLSVMPNLESLSIYSTFHKKHRIMQPNNIVSPVFYKLKVIKFLRITDIDQFITLTQRAPNLEYLVLAKHEKTPFFDEQLASIQLAHPHLTISFTYKAAKPPITTKTSTNSSSIKPGNRLMPDVSTHLSTQGESVFDAPISPFYNRKSIYNILSLTNYGWQYFTDRKPLALVGSVEAYQIVHINHENFPTSIGRVNIKLNPGNCIPLTSLTAYDQLKTFYSTKDLSIYYSPTINQYCVHGVGDTQIQYTIYYQHEKVLYPPPTKAPLIGALVKSASGLSSFIMAISRQYKNKPNELPIDLAAYFNTFASNEIYHNSGQSPNDQLWQLFKTGHGVCLQRSIIYKHILDTLNSKHAFNLPTHLVISGPHAFVEVIINGIIRKIDLGGAVVERYTEISRLPDLDLSAADLDQNSGNYHPNKIINYPNEAIDKKNPTIKDLKQTQKKVTHLPYAWEQPALSPPESLPDYCQWVLNNIDPFKLIILHNREKIEFLAYSLIHDASELVYFLDSADQLSVDISDAEIKQGAFTSIPGKLARFLQESKPKLLILNWANFGASDIAAQKTLFDFTDEPSFLNIPAEGSIQVIALIDEESVPKLHEDVFSRANKLPITDSIEEQLSWFPPAFPHHDNTDSCAQVNLYNNKNEAIEWLVGTIKAQGQLGFVYEPGKLVNAVNNKIPCLILNNPPLEDSAFRLWLHSLAKERIFFYNGKTIHLTPGFSLLYSQSSSGFQFTQDGIGSLKETLCEETFFSYFEHTIFEAKGTFKTLPGHLAQHAEKKLAVRLTAPIRNDQWDRFFDVANRNKVALDLTIAPYVIAPYFMQAISPLVSNTDIIKVNQIIVSPKTTHFYQAENLDATAQLLFKHLKDTGHDPLTIAVSETTTHEDLFLYYKMENNDISTMVAMPSSPWQHLQEGKTLILKGSLTASLRQQALSLFQDSPYLDLNNVRHQLQGQLILISEDFYPEFLQANTLNKLSITADTPEPLSPKHHQVKTVSETSQAASDLFKQWRLDTIHQALTENPVIFLEGETGTGKTSFIHYELAQIFPGKSFNLYEGMDSLVECMGDQISDIKILFVDEANLLFPGSLDLFNGLYTQTPGILHKGTFYPYSDRLKIIMAGNPSSYEGRVDHSLLTSRASTITFPALPDAYLIHEILYPVFQLGSPDLLHQEIMQAIDHFIVAYHKNSVGSLTARNLQMMVLRYLVRRDKTVLNSHELNAIIETEQVTSIARNNTLLQQYYSCPVGSMPDFYITESRCTLLRLLAEALRIRKLKIKNPTLVPIGVNGLLIEGESGIGKSTLLNIYLDYLQHEASRLIPSQWEIVESSLAQAFDRGVILQIDEINLNSALEKPLNAYLFGHDQNGVKSSEPGFFVLGTENPASYPGRHPLSPALKNRFQVITLPTYLPHELIEIAEYYGMAPSSARTLTHSFLQNQLQKHLNPRDLIKETKVQLNLSGIVLTSPSTTSQFVVNSQQNPSPLRHFPQDQTKELFVHQNIKEHLPLIKFIGHVAITVCFLLSVRNTLLLSGLSTTAANMISQVISMVSFFLFFTTKAELGEILFLTLLSFLANRVISKLFSDIPAAKKLQTGYRVNLKSTLGNALTLGIYGLSYLAHPIEAIIALTACFIITRFMCLSEGAVFQSLWSAMPTILTRSRKIEIDKMVSNLEDNIADPESQKNIGHDLQQDINSFLARIDDFKSTQINMADFSTLCDLQQRILQTKQSTEGAAPYQAHRLFRPSTELTRRGPTTERQSLISAP